ncbi:MAG TPA: hypothetical protein VM327_04950 [Candidatus Thermoplasmatota archaeon]|nr:hypothetical protein [Candidatus Thermoplasmatota archaeon]
MASARRVSALPLPQAELDKLKATLSPHYGGQVWEGAGARILVVRVPRAEPDIVNDIEEAVEYLSPADTQDLTAALLVGQERTHAVPTQPFAALMARRVQGDHDQCQELRRKISSDTGHLVYRHPADPRKVLRLAVRIPHDSAQALGDEDFARWATDLGPSLQAGKFAGVRAVYLIARKDDVRLDGDLFFQDLRARVQEEQDRHSMAARLVAKQAATPAPPPPRVVYAPLKRIEEPSPGAQGVGAHGLARPPAQGPTPAPEAASLQPLFAAAQARLASAGFDVALRPKARHTIDLAAERGEGDIQRVIVRLPERLTAEVAAEVLKASRELDVDLALVVCADAEPAARRAFIATKARWLHPDDLAELHL